MADLTPKYTRLCQTFMQRIDDPVVLGGSGVDELQPGGIIQSKAGIESYVNRAMFALIEMYWSSLNGNKLKFAEIFPELVVTRDVTFSTGSYTIASPNFDLFQILEAVSSGTYFEASPSGLYQAASYGPLQFRGTAVFPKIIKINNTIKTVGLSVSGTITLTILKHPLHPETGNLLQQSNSDASYESPFSEQWIDKIADIAEALYRKGAHGG